MRLAPDQYLPLGFPEKYEIVEYNGSIISSENLEPRDHARRRAEYQEGVWNVIWWRKIVNYIIMVLSVFLFTYPLLLSFPRSWEYPTSLRFISDLIRVSGNILPHIFDLWSDEYARNPFVFSLVLLGIGCLARLGAALKRKITDEIRAAWYGAPSELAKNSLTFRFRTSSFYLTMVRIMRLRIAPLFYAALCGLLFVYVGAIILNRAAFLYEDAAGYVCKSESSLLKAIPRGEQKSISFPVQKLCFATGILLEENQNYVLSFLQVPTESSDDVPATNAGNVADQAPGWRRLLAEPFKRIWGCPFFRVIAQIGSSGSEQQSLTPSLSEVGFGAMAVVRPRKSGELFLYVNDVILAVPSVADVFYTNKSGTATIKVRRP
jgi:hypothetical protein